ncbi:MAG TPA: VanZ family protein [Vitreimonas sp.]|nr:VanZ family protein [Vitreimonas sp.]
MRWSTTPLFTWANAFLPPFLWAGVIFLFSSQHALPSVEASELDFILKKVAHMFVYGVLYFLLHRGISLTTGPKYEKLHWSLPVLLTLLYAASDEWHQSWVAGRSATFRDIGYDLLGALIVLLRVYKFI